MHHKQLFPPEPCGANRREIDEIADLIAAEAQLRPGADLEPFVKKLGGTVTYVDLSDTAIEDTGAIIIESRHKFEILLSNFTSRVRNRFTIAHELGHYFLHYPILARKNCQMTAPRYGNGREELEANWFAAGLLMPRSVFSEAKAALGGNTSAIANHFDVSYDAAEIRSRTFDE